MSFNLKPITLIFFLGLIVRVLFLLFGAELFYGREDFYLDNDIDMFRRPILNLIESGTYTARPGHELGPFLRTPGYPFIIGFFYLLSGKDLQTAYQLIIWAQVIIDAFCIIILYKIGLRIFNKKRIPLILSFLYATYPFIIVWNAVVYAESITIFFLLLSLLFFVRNNLKYNYFLCGLFIGMAVLIRPQSGLLIPCYILAVVFYTKTNFQRPSFLNKSVRQSVLYLSLGFLLIYSSWPIRNYVNHNKVIFFQDYGCGREWGPDFVSFWDYIFALKAEWEPQFSNILHNKEVTFPESAYIVPGDSVKLAHAISLCKNCGSSFSWRKGYWKEKILENEKNCNDEITSLFNELRENQIKYNWINYAFIVPLKNIKKALFKTNLYDQKSLVRRLSSFLFLYRTLLILLGFAGIIVFFKRSQSTEINKLAIVICSFAVFWYLFMAFIHRNIEIRYFLPVDVLLLIPASYMINIVRGFMYSGIRFFKL